MSNRSRSAAQCRGRRTGSGSPNDERAPWLGSTAQPDAPRPRNFQLDVTVYRRSLKMFNRIDEYGRECPVIVVDRCIDADKVVAALDRVTLEPRPARVRALRQRGNRPAGIPDSPPIAETGNLHIAMPTLTSSRVGQRIPSNQIPQACPVDGEIAGEWDVGRGSNAPRNFVRGELGSAAGLVDILT